MYGIVADLRLPRLLLAAGMRGNLHGFKGRSNALIGDCTNRGWAIVLTRHRLAALQPGECDERIPVAAATTTARPFDRFLLAGRADIGNDHAFLEVQGFFQLDDGLFHVLLAQEEIGHDLVIVDQLILRAFDRQ